MKKVFVQHLIRDDSLYYKHSINHNMVSVVLLEMKDLKESRFYSLLELSKIILIMKKH